MRPTAHAFDSHGFYAGEVNCQMNPARGGWLLPRMATWVDLNERRQGYRQQFDGEKWVYVEIQQPKPPKAESKPVKLPDPKQDLFVLDEMFKNWNTIHAAERVKAMNDMDIKFTKQLSALEDVVSERLAAVDQRSEVERLRNVCAHVFEQNQILQQLLVRTREEMSDLATQLRHDLENHQAASIVRERLNAPVDESAPVAGEPVAEVAEVKASLWKRMTFRA